MQFSVTLGWAGYVWESLAVSILLQIFEQTGVTCSEVARPGNACFCCVDRESSKHGRGCGPPYKYAGRYSARAPSGMHSCSPTLRRSLADAAYSVYSYLVPCGPAATPILASPAARGRHFRPDTRSQIRSLGQKVEPGQPLPRKGSLCQVLQGTYLPYFILPGLITHLSPLVPTYLTLLPYLEPSLPSLT
jgi:hypothetical protein